MPIPLPSPSSIMPHIISNIYISPFNTLPVSKKDDDEEHKAFNCQLYHCQETNWSDAIARWSNDQSQKYKKKSIQPHSSTFCLLSRCNVTSVSTCLARLATSHIYPNSQKKPHQLQIYCVSQNTFKIVSRHETHSTNSHKLIIIIILYNTQIHINP